MDNDTLYLLVEGPDDTRFVDGVLRPRLEEQYGSVRTWEYAEEPNKRFRRMLQSLRAMDADYLFLHDINGSPCVINRRESLCSRFPPLDMDAIVVVVAEIESWYLAGLDDERCRELRVPRHNVTDRVTKEQFNDIAPKRFESRVAFMREMLARYSLETAVNKNQSLRYFVEQKLAVHP